MFSINFYICLVVCIHGSTMSNEDIERYGSNWWRYGATTWPNVLKSATTKEAMVPSLWILLKLGARSFLGNSYGDCNVWSIRLVFRQLRSWIWLAVENLSWVCFGVAVFTSVTAIGWNEAPEELWVPFDIEEMSKALARDWIIFEPELNQLKASFSTWKLLQEKIQMDDDS